MKFAVVVFPGSNCDHDALLRREARARPGRRVRLAQGHEPRRRRRRDPARRLRARRLPAHRRDRALLADHAGGADVRRRRRAGARHLQRLPGAARGRPAAGRDAAQPQRQVPVRARPRQASSRPTRRSRSRAAPGQVLRIPIAHGEGNYYAEPEVVARLESEPAGGLPLRRRRRRRSTPTANPNGSVNNIAGICNERAQRRRPDAASRARLRAGRRQRRRPGRCFESARRRP